MKLIEELVAEHRLIEKVAGSFVTFAGARVLDASVPARGADYLRFFRAFADLHHAREEHVLFEALVSELDLPRDRGPLAVMNGDHARFAALLGKLDGLVAREDEAARSHCATLAKAYAYGLWKHIDAEDSVLFPEAERRLERAGVRELAAPADPAAEAVRALGVELTRTWEPASDHDALRGDGCIMCPAYGATCRGLEREWWSKLEWEEFGERMATE